MADHYRGEGFAVEHCGTAATAGRYDGGIDLVLRRDGATTLVQCKHWNAAQVPHNEVHQLLGLVETHRADHAILVTSGEFTSAAWNAARNTSRITLVDGAALRLMIDPRLIPPPVELARQETGLGAWAPVAGRALDAFLEVKFGRRGRRRNSFADEFGELGLRLVLGAALIIGMAIFFRHQLSLPQSRVAAPSTRPAAAPASNASSAFDYAMRERLRRVSVQGTMVSNGVRTIVVDLAGLEAADAQAVICREAPRWFRERVAGDLLQVLRHRGQYPAVDAGRIRC